MDKGYCKDCICLVEDDKGGWFCDEFGKPIKDIQRCPEDTGEND